MTWHPAVLDAMRRDRARVVRQRSDAKASRPATLADKRNRAAYIDRRDVEIASLDRLMERT